MTYHGHGIPRKMSRAEAFKSLWKDPQTSHWIMKIATLLVPVEVLDDASGIGVIDDPILFMTVIGVLWMVHKRRKNYRRVEPDPWHVPPQYGNQPRR